MNKCNIKLGYLMIFYHAAMEKSFTSAAKKLFLTSSAVSQQVRALEISTGVSLIKVKGKKIELTEAGEGLFNYAKKIFDIASEAENYLAQCKNTSLKIGMTPFFTSAILTIIDDLKKLYPCINIIIKSDTTRQIIENMSNLQYDVGLIIHRDDLPDKFKIIKIYEGERVVLTTGWNTPIDSSQEYMLSDLAEYNFVLPSPDSTIKEILMKIFKEEGLELKSPISIQTNQTESYKLFIQMGKGIGALPEIVAREERNKRNLRILNVKNFNMRIDVDAIILKDAHIYTPAEKFVELARKKFNSNYALSSVNNFRR